MTLAELIAEGEALARPAYLLGEEPTGSAPVGYWGGVRADLPKATPAWATALKGQQHLCTLSEEALDCLHLRWTRPIGPVSLFDVELATGTHQLQARGDGRLRFRDLVFTGGTPLYATAFRSFPPFAALCYHGSKRVGEWLASEGYARHEHCLLPNQARRGLRAGMAAEIAVSPAGRDGDDRGRLAFPLARR